MNLMARYAEGMQNSQNAAGQQSTTFDLKGRL
jgi:hypothetical protein